MLLPSLSNALLVVRDPFLLIAFLLAQVSRVFPWNRFVIMFWTLGLISVLFGLALLPNAPLVIAFGFRVAFFHIPLIFLLPKVMNESDVIKFGRWFLALSIPMALLMALQFDAGPDSWLNRGIDMQFKQIGSAGDKIRPPGTFTFTAGPGYFFACTVAFILYSQFHKGTYPKVLVTSSAVATCIALAVSGSRFALGNVALVVLMAAIAVALAKPKQVTRFIHFVFVVGIALLIASQFSMFGEGMDVFSNRIDQASNTEGGFGGFVERAFGWFTNSVSAASRADVVGAGLGMGTNAGSAMLVGKATFLLAEEEWSRVILEMGPYMGFTFLTMRVGLAVWMFVRCIKTARAGTMLPAFLFGVCGMLIIVGQWSPPTVLGFTVFSGGLCLAAMNKSTLNTSGENLT